MLLVKNKQGKKVRVTKKMYDSIYKHKGFKLIGEDTETSNDEKVKDTEEKPTEKEIDLEEVTKQEIMDALDKKGVKYNSRMTKKELIELM